MRACRGAPGRLAVDSCAGEFEARTPYYYLSHEQDDGDAASSGRVVVLGSGTNWIGQGIEFDYCCVAAQHAFRRLGHEVVLVNSNPRRSRPTTTPATASTQERHARARPRRRRDRTPARRRRLARRPDTGSRSRSPKPGCPCSAICPPRSTWPRIAAASSAARAARPARPRLDLAATTAEARVRSRGRLPVLVRPRTCSAAGVCASRAARRSWSSMLRPSSTASSRARSSSTSTSSATARSAGSPRSSSTSSARESTRATPRGAAGAAGRRAAGAGDPGARLDARTWPRRAGAAQPCSWRSTTASSTSSRRTRVVCTIPFVAKATLDLLVDHACRLLGRVARGARPGPSRAQPDAPGRRRRSFRPSASPARPTAASRCARPAR